MPSLVDDKKRELLSPEAKPFDHKYILDDTPPPSMLTTLKATLLLAATRLAAILESIQEPCILLGPSRDLRPLLWNFFLALQPSFIRSRYFAVTTSTTAPRRVSSTAWLDGFRGIAAFIVYIYHSCDLFWFGESGYGFNDPNKGLYASFWRLPFVKLIHNGPMAVSLFFVISGYALSIKPLKQIRSNDHAGFATTLGSSIFRRPLRLYLPVAAVSLIMLFFARIGAYEAAASVRTHDVFWNQLDFFYVHRPSLWEDVSNWATMMEKLSLAHYEFWADKAWGEVHPWDGHVWTIPVEFFASLTLFLTQAAVSFVRPRVRIVLLLLMIWLSVRHGWIEMVCFYGGMIICEVNMMLDAANAAKSSLDTHEKSKWSRYALDLPSAAYVVGVVLGLYLLSTPSWASEETPGYRWLSQIAPRASWPWRFWCSIGAIMLIFSMSRMPQLSAIFSRPLELYLGKISFALYLLHNMVIQLVGMPVIYFLMTTVTGSTNGEFAPLVAIVLGWVVQTIVLVWASDLFCRFVDEPLARFGRWVEDWCRNKA